ncbi:hypothetical protein DZE40_001750 [Clostridium beijerinckii]|uniref:YvrJ family protein n=1 Tax=Clostridium beijerinckii TaxID=1520 RepID=UPI001570B523|nr:YvrJ family protein [Clostridium beijerinckii]NRY60655.1 hypothetical protein [Clostridium beijerinckii]
MEVNELINLIVNNGFPVAVSAYLLIRLEKQIVSLASSINKLNTIIYMLQNEIPKIIYCEKYPLI